MKNNIKKQRGIGLIEVLITTVVVAIGLLAVASLQGGLMGVSGENKIRNEAKSLCENKIEQFRDIVTRGMDDSTTSGDYIAIGMVSPAVVTVVTAATSTTPAIRRGVTTETGIVGTNETFTRVFEVTDVLTPLGKLINVTCSWGNGDADHQVVVQSELGFDSLSRAIKVGDPDSGGLGALSPSTNANSSTEIIDQTAVILDPDVSIESQTWTEKEIGQYLKVNVDDSTTGSVVYKCTGETGAYPFITFDAAKGLYTRRIHNPNVEGTFVDSIELATSNDDDLFGTDLHSCTRKIRYNGGVMLPIKGTVYSKTSSRRSLIDIDLFTFDASESGIYCSFTPDSGSTLAPYVCYAGGNCKNGPVGTTATTDGLTFTTASAGDNTIVTECPSTEVTGIVYDNVGPGGWRGEVGLLGIPTSNAAHNNVCFAEEVSGTPAVLNTARNYYTRRFTSTDALNEGINKPYMCHDFLIIDGKNTEAAIHTECLAQVGVLKSKLASKNIERDFRSATSLVDPLNAVDLTAEKSACHIISGTITNSVDVIGVIAESDTGYFECTIDATENTYECAGSAIGIDNVDIVTVSEVRSSGDPESGSVTLTPEIVDGTTLNLAAAVASHTIVVTVENAGSTVGATAITSVRDTNSSFGCILQSGSTNIPSSTYDCTVPDTWVSGTSTISALSTCNGDVATDAITSPITSNDTVTATITLPVCAIAATRTVAVDVNVSGAGTNIVTGVTGSGVSCSIASSSTSYNCITNTLDWAGTVTVASTCNGAAVTTDSDIASDVSTVSVDLPSCAAVNYTLTVTPPTNGVIKDNQATPLINCGSTCGHSYVKDSSVFLSAIPNTGFIFESWGGACSVFVDANCTVNMDSAYTVSATFVSGCNVTISGKTAVKQTAVTSTLGCSVTSAANKNYACPSVDVEDGTVVTMRNTGQADKTVTVACPTTGYTVDF